jgi:hypothetical protein
MHYSSKATKKETTVLLNILALGECEVEKNKVKTIAAVLQKLCKTEHSIPHEIL